MKILGLESSCDDSAAAIIDSKLNILSNIVISQNQEHELFKGVVPEIAARSHLANLETALQRSLTEASLTLGDIDVIAATAGPGLIGGVIVGSMYGKALASVLNKPFIAVNHLEGHALTARLTDKIEFPYLLLLASGGHCQFVAVMGMGKYKILGQTLDDAIGEAFDKVAKMMDLGFPGGPAVEKMAKDGDSARFDFPRPLFSRQNCDMSFSGLKTAVRLQIEKLLPLKKQDIHDIAASFQQTVCDIITRKTEYAIREYEKLCTSKQIVISGGVAANNNIRSALTELSASLGYNFVAPPTKLCTDNAAMIAFTGLERFKAGTINGMDFKPRARWSLEEVD
ncbi:MAG: tRNA (adenosine(37)-N6)-threonylcarbamoyltransferase complex transferase subunit TsaD [Rickettsiales bacterium]|nr:MAG: tRNA (adenosine(37)-N6)-threonylcarbamoyltransferase complex transferase subunit TsaD [Rickettsiales bacterium]